MEREKEREREREREGGLTQQTLQDQGLGCAHRVGEGSQGGSLSKPVASKQAREGAWPSSHLSTLALAKEKRERVVHVHPFGRVSIVS